MGRLAELMTEIEELYLNGDDAEVIAAKLNVPLDMVQEVIEEVQADADAAYDEERDQFNSDLEADADALASAGWGVAEDYVDYVMDNDYMD